MRKNNIKTKHSKIINEYSFYVDHNCKSIGDALKQLKRQENNQRLLELLTNK